ncbi:MAG TPA: PAS domain S-box protein [Ilumatobacter sp.]|nr:PAS domain S-box protein [Ilumatobacter sp.]
MSEQHTTPDLALLAQAVELAPDGVLIVDHAGTIVYANRSMHALSGHDDLAGRQVEELVPAAVRGSHAQMREGYNHHPTQRPMGAGLELALQRSDGLSVPVEISLSPFDHGREYVITAVRDITDRLENQRRLATAHEQLALVGERERIGRDLHDVVLQHLYGMGLGVQATALAADAETAGKLESIIDDIDRIISEVRTIVFTLGSAGHRGALGQELADVMAQASRVLGFTPALRMGGPVESALSDEIRTEMVASMREALGNVARHAGASSAQVQVEIVDDRVVMTVTDNGVGPPEDADALRGGHGLANLKGRAATFGGDCTLESGPGGKGAVLRWYAPF